MARATGSKTLTEADHKMRRRDVLENQRIAELLKRSVHPDVLRGVLGRGKNEIPNYAGRREFLRQEFDPLLPTSELLIPHTKKRHCFPATLCCEVQHIFRKCR